MASTRDDIIDEVMQAQRKVGQAMHAATDPFWLQLDLTMGQLKALIVLEESPLTVGQIADALGSGKPAASILVDRLVGLGMVERIEDRDDRRRTNVRLTDSGAELVARLRDGGRQRFHDLLGQLSDDDLAALLQGIQALALVASGERALARA